jgi:hypothetical protein
MAKEYFTKTQLRVDKVLLKMKEMSLHDQNYADMFSELLEDGLDILADDDAFGTECQDDPRGDGRNGTWSMKHVEGIDGHPHG